MFTKPKTTPPPPPHDVVDPGPVIDKWTEELALERRKNAFLLAAYNRFRISHGMAEADEAAAIADGGGP